ncbi:type VI immunity family protein [Corallococcus aberystwythensis]|uniref:type VI immunity family protein n=1 Tax=Corallococcus aberystwythensis TaxID=2316722 RepID=UPI001315815B|nr:type VI immunity family protein [Corallococcus aberystwythensis]
MSLCFYLPRPTLEVTQAVSESLQTYLNAIAPQTLTHYPDDEGEWQELDAAGWMVVREKMRRQLRSSVLLTNDTPYPNGYEFSYDGKDIHAPIFRRDPGPVTAVRFIVPLSWMRTHGALRVRELALALAAPLPFSSGHAGLAVTGFLGVGSVTSDVVPQLVQYPGVDLMELDLVSWEIGTRLRVPHWLAFIGDPSLSAMGGVDFLRSQLHAPGTTVEALDASRAVVTLGPEPLAGGPDQPLPAYRELARILEPWAFHATRRPADFPDEDFFKWDRRFLD